MTLVSVVIPAYKAQRTIGRAVRSVLDQSWTDLEVVIASDDGFGYRAQLLAGGIDVDRVVEVSTGAMGSGDGPPRNVAVSAARGEIIANLDADDEFAPDRLEKLVPLAQRYGAATDNTLVIYESGEAVKQAFPTLEGPGFINAADILTPRVPIFPVVRRALADRGWLSVPFAGDVLFNLHLICRAEAYAALPDNGYIYYKTAGSITNAADTADVAERGYLAILSALARDTAYLSDDAVRSAAVAEFKENLAVNQLFRRYRADGRCGSLEEFLDRTENGRAAWLESELVEARISVAPLVPEGV